MEMLHNAQQELAYNISRKYIFHEDIAMVISVITQKQQNNRIVLLVTPKPGSADFELTERVSYVDSFRCSLELSVHQLHNNYGIVCRDLGNPDMRFREINERLCL